MGWATCLALGGAPRGELTLSSGVGTRCAWPQEGGAPETSGTSLPSQGLSSLH